MLLSESFRLGQKELVAFTGAGGKTSAMMQLAAELVAHHKRVVVTTTTRMGAAQAQAPNAVTLHYEPGRALALAEALAQQPLVFVVGDPVEGTKVEGVPPGFVDALAGRDDVDALLVEADGARTRALKAPAMHEPVVPDSTTLLVPVVGASILGQPLDEAHVHRPEIVARLTGARLGDPLVPALVARVLAHPEGGLKGKPPAARAIALVNQVETPEELEGSRRLAHLLLAYDRERPGGVLDAVALGAARQSASPVCETHRRVAAIVLAAGAGVRMGTQVKQLLPWEGTTLIENAVGIATRSSVDATIVVLGAHAEEIRPLLRNLPVRVALNPDWAEGHSTSIRVGLQTLAPNYDAVIFVNADQPRLTPEVVNALVQRYRETDAGIVAPLYAGKRGSPVLFRRIHFPELMSLSGEQGGREVLVHHPVEHVSFADAAASDDMDTPEDYERLRRRGPLD